MAISELKLENPTPVNSGDEGGCCGGGCCGGN
jgi:hypothetical protein